MKPTKQTTYSVIELTYQSIVDCLESYKDFTTSDAQGYADVITEEEMLEVAGVVRELMTEGEGMGFGPALSQAIDNLDETRKERRDISPRCTHCGEKPSMTVDRNNGTTEVVCSACFNLIPEAETLGAISIQSK